MDLDAKIIGYHTNSLSKCMDFITTSHLVWCEEDGNWLGSGMYFWDNLSNAKFWQVKKEKYGAIDVKIVRALLSLTDLLDLTD